jgi:hypothetical protein
MLIRKYEDKMQTFKKSSTNLIDCKMIFFGLMLEGSDWATESTICGYSFFQDDNSIQFNRSYSKDTYYSNSNIEKSPCMNFQVGDSYESLWFNRTEVIGVYSPFKDD